MIVFQSRYLLRVLVSMMFLTAGFVSLSPQPANATGIGPMGPAAMSPFYGMPYYQGQNCGMVGQMPGYGQCGVDPMAVFYGLNWGGAQRMGASYLTPIGMPTLMNSYNHAQMMNSMSASGAY